MLTPGSEIGIVADLTQCEHEPIRTPGSVQAHGVLIALSEPDLRIRQISENCSEFLGQPADALTGQLFATLYDEDFYKTLKEKLLSSTHKELNPLRLYLRSGLGRRAFNGIAHRTNQSLILELEPISLRDNEPSLGFYQPARTAIGRLRDAKNLHELANVAVGEIHSLTGFDRVVVYTFDEQWNGKVIAEKLSKNIDSYLGLHFPASDIPKQARDLYTLNWSRFIPDVDYKESALYPPVDPSSGRPLDLSFATLRSVSPVHREYLRNMGCTGSMSISLIKDGKLWGLISCTHTSEPIVLRYEVRAVCEFLGEIVSSLLSGHEQSYDFEGKIKARSYHAVLLERMTRSGPDFIRAITGDRPNLLDLTNSDGAAVFFGGKCYTVGVAPTGHEISELVDWLSLQPIGEEVFATDNLAALFPQAVKYSSKASGIIAAPLSQGKKNFVLWFRPEVIQSVNWGGNPAKAVRKDGTSLRLHPRKSFELWKETVRLKSLPWAPHEKDAAASLQKSIMEAVLEQSEELLKLNLELKRSNLELDSFAYAASHDLKEPLRGIHNYATYIKRESASVLPDSSIKRLDTVIRLSQRMESLINSLLHYSQVGRTDLSFREVELKEVLENVLESLRHQIEESKVDIIIPRPLPKIFCDKVRIAEVFSNLISNSIKYNDKPEKSTEIGFLHRADEATVFYVKDNGIGIKPEFYDTVFKIFRRLHPRDRYGGGTGTGLTITKRIIERHNGKIWIESTEGHGTTFFFTLEEEEPRSDAQ